MNKKAVCVISGGMDSATAAYIAKSMGYDIIALHNPFLPDLYDHILKHSAKKYVHKNPLIQLHNDILQ